MASPSPWILPSGITYKHYDLDLSLPAALGTQRAEVTDADFTFRGTNKISLVVDEPGLTTITLHAHKLSDFTDVMFTPVGSAPIAAAGVRFDEAHFLAFIDFGAPLPTGPATLSITYTGLLSEDLAGLYRAKDNDGYWSLVSQCEATDFRRVAPAADEPARKVTWTLSVKVPSGLTALSNAAVARTHTDGEWTTTSFQPTVLLPCYLFALTVGRFDRVSTTSPGGVLVSVYTPVGKASQGEFALKVAVDALELFAKLFGVAYTGGVKLDHVAAPSFAAGAMENHGCILYRESCLLVGPETPLSGRQRVAIVVAHETSHLWFGNHATMTNWSGLYLNESFATICETWATDELFPAWKLWDGFAASQQAAAFRLDALASTHPIEQQVLTPAEADEAFDAVSYSKGGSILRMLFDGLLSFPSAWAGMRIYFARHGFKNTTTADLFAALTEASGRDVSGAANNWIYKCGFPFLSVETRPDGGLALSSARYIAPWALRNDAWPGETDFATGPSPAAFAAVAAATAAAVPAAPDTTNDWVIPLSIVTPTGTARLDPIVLDASVRPAGVSREQELEAAASRITAAAAGAPFFKLNAGQVMFYRTIYDEAALAALLPAVGSLAVSDRLGLVGDVAAGVAVGMTPALSLLKLAAALAPSERDPNVWDALLGALDSLWGAAKAADPSGALGAAVKTFISKALGPVVAAVGWAPVAGEPETTALLRGTVLRWAAITGDAGVVAEALSRFDAAMAPGGAPVPADLRATVYNTAAAEGGASRYEALLARFKATTGDEQRAAMTALGRASDRELLSRTLAMILVPDESGLRTQDAPWVAGAVASNAAVPGAGEMVWEWFTANWDRVHALFGGGNFLWSSMVGAAAGHVTSKAAVDAVAAFFATHETGSATRKVAQCMEAVRNRVWQAAILQKDAGFTPAAVAALL